MKASATGTGANSHCLMALAKISPSTAAGTKPMSTLTAKRQALPRRAGSAAASPVSTSAMRAR